MDCCVSTGSNAKCGCCVPVGFSDAVGFSKEAAYVLRPSCVWVDPVVPCTHVLLLDAVDRLLHYRGQLPHLKSCWAWALHKM
jgi:hypothetical protein